MHREREREREREQTAPKKGEKLGEA